MSILDSLYPALQLRPANQCDGAAHEEPASEEAIRFFLQQFPNTPPDYIEILRTYDGCILISEEPPFYMWLYELGTAYGKMKQWHPFLLESLPDCVFFGQDGDDIYFYGSHEGKAGVYVVETAVADWEDATYLASSIRSLVCEGEGWRDEKK